MSGRRIVVVGGGISGLATAYRLTRTHNGEGPLDVTVLERSARSGGKLWTSEFDGMPVEAGADSFVVRKPWAVDLCKELGLADELVRPGASGAAVWTRGRLVPFPESSAFGIPSTAMGMMRWPGLTPRGRFRALADLYRSSSGGDGDQPLGALVRRRLGPEALRVLVGPLLAGIHAGDPDRMSLLATFPELRTWERGHESLIRGARAALKAAQEFEDPPPLFATLWDGLSSLKAALEGAVGEERIWLGSPAESLGLGEDRRLEVRVGGIAPLEAEAVVLAAPAFESARILQDANPEAARLLTGIRHVSTAVVFLSYPPAALPEGTGFVVPLGERTITACTFVSAKWPRPEYGGRVVLRCFVGREGAQDVLRQDDEAVAAAAARDVEEALGLAGPPSSSSVVRWPDAMPQYDVGHLDRLAAIEAALARTPGVFVTGAGLRGVGIADCVRQANETAERVLAHIRARKASPGEGSGDGHDDGRRETNSWQT